MIRVYRVTGPVRSMVTAELEAALSCAYLWHRYGWRVTLTSYIAGEDSLHPAHHV